jgi:hypothetical protein
MSQAPTGVPDTLRFAFQEYELEKLDPDEHAFTIIERTLTYGNKAELHWLFAYYGREQLVNWLEHGGWRTLPRRRLLLWTTYFNLKPFPQRRGVWPH